MDILPLSKKLMDGSKSLMIDFSYLMGVMMGDGYYWSSSKIGYGLGLRVTDKPFALSFKRTLENLGFKTHLGITHTQIGTRLYQVRTSGNGYRGCKDISLWFEKLDLGTIEGIINNDKEKMVAFVRGFYESEGCVGYLSKAKNQRPTSYRIRMGCNDKDVVKYIDLILQKLGYTTKFWKTERPYKNRIHVAYRLHITSIPQVTRFFNEINPSIKRTIKLPRTQRQKDRIKMYEKALELHSKGITNTEIMREIGVPDNTVHYWVKGVNKPRGLDCPEVVIL